MDFRVGCMDGFEGVRSEIRTKFDWNFFFFYKIQFDVLN